MQRVHVEDLAGILMEDPSWHVLELPAIADVEQTIPLTFGRSMTRPVDDLLSLTREPLDIAEAASGLHGQQL